jgi:hypothetical protein
MRIIGIPPFAMIGKIDARYRKVEMLLTVLPLTVTRHISILEERCIFSLYVFLDDQGYFMKPKNGSMFYHFHARHDHVWASSSLLNKESALPWPQLGLR